MTDRGVTRRQLLGRSALLAAGGLGLAGSYAPVRASTPGYDGPVLLCVQLDGGVDATSWCDPKENTPGERRINNWADSASTREVGRIQYAPFADNALFFERHFQDMLVINGIDAQTNSHTTGVTFNCTGSNVGGRPTLSALFAAKQAPDLPLAYTSYGAYSPTEGLLPLVSLSSADTLRSVLDPHLAPYSLESMRSPEWISLVDEVQTRYLETRLAASQSPRERKAISNDLRARSGREGLLALQAEMPENFAPPETPDQAAGMPRVWSLDTKAQVQGALTAFKAGVGSAADVRVSSFDTHERHDEQHSVLLTFTSGLLNFIWEEAERLEIGHRLTVVVTTDFGRTNFYNSIQGKDHWPIGSAIVMAKDAEWGNRVVGKTDAIHNALPIDTNSLQESSGGTLIHPHHVHKALQKQLGIEDTARSLGFGFDDVVDLPLFDPGKYTT